MLKTRKNLEVFYPNMIHSTCLAHALHLVAETVRENYPTVNKLISKTKKVFLKAPLRRELYREMCPELPLPPEPVITRWGTWLEAAIFYHENFQKIKAVIESFNDNADCISKAKEAFRNSAIQANLAYVVSHFKIILQTTKALEASAEPLCENIRRIENLREELKNAPGKIAKIVAKRLEEILIKNPGYSRLLETAQILSGESTNIPLKMTSAELPCFKYAPVTSCDVERSFSSYKQILTDNRRRLTPEHLEKMLICYVNP